MLKITIQGKDVPGIEIVCHLDEACICEVGGYVTILKHDLPYLS